MTAADPSTSGLSTEDSWGRLHDIARKSGVVPALTALSEAPGAGLLCCGPGGHAIAPGRIVRDARRVWFAGVECDRERDTEVSCSPAPLAQLGLVVVRQQRTGTGPAAAYRSWTIALTWLRLGLSRRLMDSSIASLKARKVGNSSLLQQQLVKGSVADVAIDHLEIQSLLSGSGECDPLDDLVAELHRRCTEADRTLLRLLGAAGFTLDGPGQVAYVSELLADAYVESTR